MKVIQILPELNSGGVERGTLEVAAHLVAHGHESIVISNGGRLVADLENAGSRHLTMPVHRKALASLAQISALRNVFIRERPDIIHLRSRMPAWLAWLAWKSMDKRTRPRLVTTVHGFYSVNAYSAIMTRGESVITVSESVREYVLKNYPKTDPSKVRVIHRGVDETAVYPMDFTPSADWLGKWKEAQPELEGRIPLLMPARLTRWKGQVDFIELIAKLIKLGRPVHGLIVGEPHPKKLAFLDELKALAATRGVSDRLSFLGHRSDLREIMSVSTLVYSLSLDPEAFGRVSLEAMALGKPCVGYDHGGVAEQLAVIFPEGRVPVGDVEAALAATLEILDQHKKPASIGPFTLRRMLESTMDVYEKLLASPR
ncbi:MAG: glycosyltransferase family 4 protein [Verrucomicrobiota bacterium]